MTDYERLMKLAPIIKKKFNIEVDEMLCRCNEEKATEEDWGMFRVPMCEIYEINRGYSDWSDDDNKNYGECINEELYDYIDKYPELFCLMDCSWCCGCGDW